MEKGYKGQTKARSVRLRQPKETGCDALLVAVLQFLLLHAFEDNCRNLVSNIATEVCHLFDDRTRDKRVLRARHQEHRLQVGQELSVHKENCVFVVKVRNCAQPANYNARLALAAKIDQQPFECLYLYLWVVADHFADNVDAFFGAKHPFFRGILENRDGQLVHNTYGPLYNIQMAVGKWVEAARVDCAAHGACLLVAARA